MWFYFSFAELPTELQLEIMEDDNNMSFGDEIQPDEQQMEVLEDIWLKAGEIGKNAAGNLGFFLLDTFFIELL